MLGSHRGRWLLRLPAALVMVAAASVPLSAQVFQGRVVDAGTRDPIDGATVVLVARDSVTLDAASTDSVGQFSVAAEEEGSYRLIARRIGYPATISHPLEVSEGDTLRVEFRISAGAVLLDPVVVTGRRRRPPPDIAAFYARAERAIFGTFLTRDQIERANAMRASDLLRRVPGVQVGPMRYGAAVATMRGCLPTIIVDGVIANFETSIDNLVSPRDLEGLEVYRASSQVPVEYGGLRVQCGAIMIWTRRGP